MNFKMKELQELKKLLKEKPELGRLLTADKSQTIQEWADSQSPGPQYFKTACEALILGQADIESGVIMTTQYEGKLYTFLIDKDNYKLSIKDDIDNAHELEKAEKRIESLGGKTRFPRIAAELTKMKEKNMEKVEINTDNPTTIELPDEITCAGGCGNTSHSAVLAKSKDDKSYCLNCNPDNQGN